MEVSIKTGSKTTQVKKRKKQIIKMDWLSQSIITEHETAKWEITGLDTHQSINKRGCITGFITTMA